MKSACLRVDLGKFVPDTSYHFHPMDIATLRMVFPGVTDASPWRPSSLCRVAGPGSVLQGERQAMNIRSKKAANACPVDLTGVTCR